MAVRIPRAMDAITAVPMTSNVSPCVGQPAIVNSIYYPTGDLAKRRAYEHGEPVRVGSARQDRLLMIEGPLALAARPSKSGAPRRMPKIRIESAAIDHSDPPTSARLATWIEQELTIPAATTPAPTPTP